MRQREDELERRGVRLVVVTFESGWRARDYQEELGVPVLIDEDRALYRAYGLGSVPWWRVWGPRTLWTYARLIARGRRPRKSEGDVQQRGGDVLIDPSGVVRLHHAGADPADRPPVSSLLETIDRA